MSEQSASIRITPLCTYQRSSTLREKYNTANTTQGTQVLTPQQGSVGVVPARGDGDAPLQPHTVLVELLHLG